MLIINKIYLLVKKLEEFREKGKKVGFVPTMGALHEGHISLVKRSNSENDVTVVSIFVNPTQFNNPDDLNNYPRTPESDHIMLSENEVDILFSPDVNEMYNQKREDLEKIDLGNIAKVMEGAHRPGHFSGVVQIVSRLFEIVKPQIAYFGEKDFQQLAIIRVMTSQLGYPVKITGCPTIREKNGLAMSSRNMRLTENGLNAAAQISQALNFANENWRSHKPENLIKLLKEKIEKNQLLKVEYIEIADEKSLEKITAWDDKIQARCFAAVYCENVRLIDNMKLN